MPTRADPRGTAAHPLRCPLRPMRMVVRHVHLAGGVSAAHVTSGMHRNTPPVTVDLNRMPVAVNPHPAAHMLVRHRVPVVVETDMVVEPDLGGAHLDVAVRQQRQRPQRRPLLLLEHLGARARARRERPPIDCLQQPADLAVELGQRLELTVAQRRDDPPRHLLHRILGDRLVPRPGRTRRHDRRGIVVGPLPEVRVQLRIIAPVTGDRRLQVVGHHHLRRPAEILEHPGAAREPVIDLLRPARLGMDVVRHPQRRHKNLRLASAHPDRRPGVVDKHRLAQTIPLPHGAPRTPLPLLAAAAEPRIAMRIAPLAKLLPQKLQGHPLALHLARHPLEINLQRIGCRRAIAMDQTRQPRLVNSVRQRPADAGLPRPLRQLVRRRLADVQPGTDATVRPAAIFPQPDNLGNLPHMHSPSGHGRHLLQSGLPIQNPH